MSLKKRIVARLDIKGARLIKGIRFEGLRVIGDPCESALKYYQDGIDEIFYSDAVASLYGRNSLNDLLRNTCRDVFVPITAGGGIKTIEDGHLLLTAGADKLAVNSCAVKNPNLITSLAERFGEQCVVLSIQARRNIALTSGWEVMIESGRERTSLDLLDWIQKVQKLGVGEIFLTSVDNDGTQKGPDLQLLELVNSVMKVPLVFGGGFNKLSEIKDAFKYKCLNGISIGASLHNNDLEINQIKSYLSNESREIGKHSITTDDFNKIILNEAQAVVVDYGMGNQQSLVNALRFIGFNVIVTDDPISIEKAELSILPGVGSFPSGIKELNSRGITESIKRRCLSGKATIGICLGMQLFFEKSMEFKETKGLGIFKGSVINLKDHKVNINLENDIDINIQLPHMGWNNMNRLEGKSDFFCNEDIINQSYYFVHNYGIAESKYLDFYCTTSYYGRTPIAICGKSKTIGFQFHPERSGKAGLILFKKIICKLMSRD